MKFSCNYENLLKCLTDVSEVVEDNFLNEDARNVIFDIKDNSITLIGINKLIVYRKFIDLQYFDILEGDSCMIQVRCKELIEYLSSYKALRRTTVEEVSFDVKDRALICKVVEKDKDLGSLYSSSWVFTLIPIKPVVEQQLAIKRTDDDLVTIGTQSLLFFTRNMLPLLQSGTTLYSKLVFADDYVIVFTPTNVMFIKNILGGSFSGFTLLYRSVVFLDRVLCSSPTVSVNKSDRYLYFETDDSRTFLLFDNRLPEYNMYVSKYTKDHAFTVDRIYFKDILKRLKLLNEAVEVTIDCEMNEILLKNSKYSQSIPILQTKALDGFDKIRFKILPDVLNKSILGSDDEFSGELFVYYCTPDSRNTMLVFADDSGSWFNTITVKTF